MLGYVVDLCYGRNLFFFLLGLMTNQPNLCFKQPVPLEMWGDFIKWHALVPVSLTCMRDLKVGSFRVLAPKGSHLR